MTRLYAISDRTATPEITCREHLRSALETHATCDAYLLDIELLRPSEIAQCDRCTTRKETQR